MGDENSWTADEYRRQGNDNFSNGSFDQALAFYNIAIDKAASETGTKSSAPMILHLCNRSACLFRMERYGEARDDALQAAKLSDEEAFGGAASKAYFRLARAQMALRDNDNAVETLETALREPYFTVGPKEMGEEDRKAWLQQKKGLEQLLTKARQPDNVDEDKKAPSIKHYEKGKHLGEGNFSSIYLVKHRKTAHEYALKQFNNDAVRNLAKRQHPNVWNEIAMEERILLERLPPHKFVVQAFCKFQDYGNRYILMKLYGGGDLWSTIRYKKKMVGCHRALVKTYLWELLDSLEHLHSHGIVHRDLKPENVLISDTGHVVLIDFGTAKDLIKTDLNGPEFVGTPDFMAPEAVSGTAGQKEAQDAAEKGHIGAVHTLDLWALGAVAFQLFTGQTPFDSPSQYLAFLKMERGFLRRPWGIDNDEAWDLIRKLMQVDPQKRLGADGFELVVPSDGALPASNGRTMVKRSGYTAIREHSFFQGTAANLVFKSRPVPSLRDLCIRSCAELVQKDAHDLNIDSIHKPGNGTSHDMLRLQLPDRKAVMHLLDRLRVLSEPMVYRRFFKSKMQSRLQKVRPDTLDYVGLTQMLDKQGQPLSRQNKQQDGHYNEDVGPPEPVSIYHFTIPKQPENNEDEKKEWAKKLDLCKKTINKQRPKVVVASGNISEYARKTLAMVNETIPVAINDESLFFSFWMNAAQGLVLPLAKLAPCDLEHSDDEDFVRFSIWLEEELEQSRCAKNLVFAFVDGDPGKVPQHMLDKLAKGGVKCLMGPSESAYFVKKHKFAEKEKDEEEFFEMKIIGQASPYLRGISFDEESCWSLENILK